MQKSSVTAIKTGRGNLSPQHIFHAYENLPPPLQDLLQVLSLMGGLSFNTLAPALKVLGLSPVGLPWTENTYGEAKKMLCQQGLLTIMGQCSLPALEHRLACAAVERPHLVQAMDACFQRIRQGQESVTRKFAALAMHMRLCMYSGDHETFETLLLLKQTFCYEYLQKYNVQLDEQDFDSHCIHLGLEAQDWYASRPESIKCALVSNNVRLLLKHGRVSALLPVMLQDMDSLLQGQELVETSFDVLLFLIYQGKFAQAKQYIADWVGRKNTFIGPYFQGILEFFQGDTGAALPLLKEALKRYRRLYAKRRINMPFPADILLALCILATNDPEEHNKLDAYFDLPDSIGRGWEALRALWYFARGMEQPAQRFIQVAAKSLPDQPFERIVVMVADAIIGGKSGHISLDVVEQEYQKLAALMPLLGHILAEILALRASAPQPFQEKLEHFPQPVIRMLNLLSPGATWEKIFDNLTHALCHDAPSKGGATAKRLVWHVHFMYGTLTPLEQCSKKSGWTAGRPISLKRLYEDKESFSYFTAQDHKVLKALSVSRGWRGRMYEFDFEQALQALVEHPLLFEDSTRTSVHLEQKNVELEITEQATGYAIGLSQPSAGQDEYFDRVVHVGDTRIVKEGDGQYCLYQMSPRLKEISTILGAEKLTIPQSGAERIMNLLRDIDPSIPLKARLNTVAESVASIRPVVQLRPLNGGLQVALGVRPFGCAESPFFLTGQGNMRPMALIAGQTRKTTRLAADEACEAQKVIAACPTLLGYGDAGPWELAELEEALTFLMELKNISEEPSGLAYFAQPGALPLIEWPQGETLRVEAAVSAKNLSVQIQHKRDWFQLQGQLTLSEGLVVDMGKVLDKLAEAQGAFVPLEGGAFVALTQQFKRQLKRLASLSESEKDGSRRMHPLGAAALDATLEGVHSLSVDNAWTQLMAKIRAAQAHTPALPSTLRAELRDYQQEGFAWLSRLAHWGAGACLADDMGLGKTVQTIAVLLELASRGPALIVAPTSVCHNWHVELTRFAPTLCVHRMALGKPAARKELVLSMRAGDVLIISYGLLHTVTALLASRPWQAVVFDEAQALKNAATKRAKASKVIDAAFRVALTGTPIENYLEDVWSLFNTINPGLLGNLKSFQKRFGGPGSDSRQALKALLRPFILRRTKSAVLTELPPRTEQILQVSLPPAEQAFYEAMRRKALENLEKTEDVGAGQRKFSILAELTRLRRACCHPRLIDPDSPLEGAKLQAFLELVRELLRGRHKALVFSQFVGHLSIVRKALDSKGIAYQYLDGATPEKERQQSVRDFQDGQGDLFLISLKAGGQGLNLTAADYVIHLDPWWNPAVEDQASDRAHRIGQERPVTVYRLVIAGSVEERILELHKSKRSLASDFLDGTDTPLTEKELLALFESSAMLDEDGNEG